VTRAFTPSPAAISASIALDVDFYEIPITPPMVMEALKIRKEGR
jgi:hypothetical protein